MPPREVLAAENAPRVLVLTTFDEDEVVDEALRRGITGFLLKSSPPQDMVDAIRRAASRAGRDRPVRRTRGDLALRQRTRLPARSHRSSSCLTPRETDVLRLVGRGYSNAEIAAELYLGETTVKTHLGRVLDKLDLRDRPRAIAFAYESGLISAGERPRSPCSG